MGLGKEIHFWHVECIEERLWRKTAASNKNTFFLVKMTRKNSIIQKIVNQ